MRLYPSLLAAIFLVVFNAHFHSAHAAHSYLGIRYAEPPPRWLPLGLPEIFDPISLLQRNSSENIERDGCVQFGQNPFANATEDCFFLNIWLPDNRNVSNVSCDPIFGGCNLPVLFYIYGGGFQSGRAKYGVEPLQIPNLFDGSDFADQGARASPKKLVA
jgi:carboxylesterase type B